MDAVYLHGWGTETSIGQTLREVPAWPGGHIIAPLPANDAELPTVQVAALGR